MRIEHDLRSAGPADQEPASEALSPEVSVVMPCLNEAETAFEMSRHGTDLEVIRTGIDGLYGG